MKIIKNLSVAFAFLCTSLFVNAQTPWTIVENDGVKTISLNYWKYGSDVDYDGISDTWQGSNSAIFKESVGDKYWIPQMGEQFSLTMNGTANFSGIVQIHLADVRAEVGYWGRLTEEYVSIEVQENEPFQIQKTFTISQVESDGLYSEAGTFLSEPSFVIMEIPTITSKNTDFDNRQVLSLDLTVFEFTYVKNESKKTFEIAYNPKGGDRDSDEISDTWQSVFPTELSTALNESGVSSWTPEVGESFTLKMNGVANFTGELGYYIVDQMVDPQYWTYLSATDDSYFVEQGKAFTLEKTFVITINEKYGTPLNNANFVIGCMPQETSQQSGFDNEKILKLNLSNYSLVYNPAPDFAKVFVTEYDASGEDFDGDGISDKWQSTFPEELQTALTQAEISNWSPKKDEKFTIKMKGFANFTGTFDLYVVDQSDEVGKWALMSDSVDAISVTAGQLFDIEKEIVIRSVEKDGVPLVHPELIISCFPSIQSTTPGFDNTTKESFYLTDYSITYDSVYTVVKTFTMDYNLYGYDKDYDNISDSWQSTYRDEVTNATGSTAWKPQKGDLFPMYMKGFADFSGTVYCTLADLSENAGYWGELCDKVISFSVTKGELFEVKDTIKITKTQKDGTNLSFPELVIHCEPDITSKQSGFDKTKKLTLFLGEYSFTYKNPAVIKTFDVLYDAKENDSDGDGISDVWRTSFLEELPFALQASNVNLWEPKVGDTFTITMRGTANYTGTLNFIISEQTTGSNFKALMTEVDNPISVVAGKVLNIERTLMITSIEGNAQLFKNPSFEIICEPSVTSTNINFNEEEKKTLSLTEYSIQFDEAPEFYKIFHTKYDNVAPDRDLDGISDTWQSAFEDEMTSALTAKGIVSWTPMVGEMFSVYAEGISNFSGRVKLYVGEIDESGNVVNACKEENDFIVTAGKGFEEEFSFTLQNSEIANPQLIVVCEPQRCSKEAYFDVQAKKSLYLFEYSIVYTPNYNFVKIFDVNYSPIGNDSDKDDISDVWQTIYDNELDASWHEFEITDFIPANGEKFTIKAKGVANYSGEASFSIIDDSPEVGYWANLCQENCNIEFQKGALFEFEHTFVVTNEMANGVPITQAKLAIACLPKITSTSTSFDDKKIQKLSLLEYSIEYSGPAPEIEIIRDRKLAVNGKTLELSLENYCKSLDGAKLTYDVVIENENLASVSIENNVLKIKPGLEEGKTSIELQVTSSNGTMSTRKFNITITEMQEIQILETIEDIEAEFGTEIPNIDLSQYFTIADGVNLSYEAISSNVDVAVVSVINNTLTIQQIGSGTTEIIIYVESSEGALEEQRFSITLEVPQILGFNSSLEDIVVYSYDKTICVKNAVGKQVVISYFDGRKIHCGKMIESNFSFPIRLSGVYIVQVNEKIYTVIVK